jgi:hypothetical protein
MATATTRRRRKPILPHPRAEKLSPFAGELTHTCGGIDAGLRLNRPRFAGEWTPTPYIPVTLPLTPYKRPVTRRSS